MQITNTPNVTISNIEQKDNSGNILDIHFELPNGELVICRSTQLINGTSHKDMAAIAETLWEIGDDVQFSYSLDEDGGKILRDVRSFENAICI